jgi:hypothetical protein
MIVVLRFELIIYEELVENYPNLLYYFTFLAQILIRKKIVIILIIKHQ